MQRFKSAVWAGGGIACLIGTLSIVTSSRVQSQGSPSKDVRVVNTSAEAVPVAPQGTLSVAGWVNASQLGAWNVGIVGMPAVAQGGSLWMFGLDSTKNAVQDPAAEGLLVAANGHLSNVELAAAKLTFDGNNNLKTAPQGTQNVNVVGGTVSAAPQIADTAVSFGAVLPPSRGSTHTVSLAATGIVIDTSTTVSVTLALKNGAVTIGTFGSGQTRLLFPIPMAVKGVEVDNVDPSNSCDVSVDLIGF